MVKELTDENIAGFAAWLDRRGRGEETARCYTSNLRMCRKASSLTSRLRDKKLAPKTRWANMAALTQWAKYAADAELASDLTEIRLPPSIRSKPKQELDMAAWSALMNALADDSIERRWSGLTGAGNFTANRAGRTGDAPARGSSSRLTIPRGIRLILQIVGTRGLRIGDSLRITRPDLQQALATGKLSFEAKGGRRLEYDAAVLKPYLRELDKLPDWESVRDLVGRPASSDRAVNTALRRALSTVAAVAGVAGVHPHRLRRTYATWFVRRLDNNPQALIMLMKHMGWTNINTAAQYVDNVNLDELDAMGADLVAEVMGQGKAPKKAKR